VRHRQPGGASPVSLGLRRVIRPATLLATALCAALPGAAQAQGLYINAFAGALLFDSTVTVGGTKLVDQGGDAFLGGMRAGYSWRFDSGLYLAVEAEGFAATGRSRAMVNGVAYTYQVDGGIGAYGVVGWVAPARAVFFARVGPMLAFTNSGDDVLASVGVGAEIPFAPRWSARIDADYSWGNSIEHYRATLGVVWRY
jgi:hypothetical protein